MMRDDEQIRFQIAGHPCGELILGGTFDVAGQEYTPLSGIDTEHTGGIISPPGPPT